MKFLTFLFGLVIGLIAAYGAVAADVIDLPFLDKEDEIVVEEPVEVVEEEEDNLIVRGYSYDPEVNGVSYVDFGYSFSDEFVTMVEETSRFINNVNLPYQIEEPETVYIGATVVNEETGSETTIYEYNLETNEYSERFEYSSSTFFAVPFAVDGNKLIVEKSPIDGFDPAPCTNPWTMFDKEYFELDNEETVAQAYELPERLASEVALSVSECEYVVELTGFTPPF